MSIWIGCPDSNFRRGRPFGLRPEAIVVHIMDGNFAAGESVFRNPATQKSAHYGISGSGEVHQYVDENDTAFHAGIVVNPTWPLLKPRVNPNFYTIGIEHEGRPDDVWPDAQLSSSATLIGQIAARWGIPPDDSHVIHHHQIRASKTCPGNWLQMGSLLERVLAAMPVVVPPPTSPSDVRKGNGPSPRTTPPVTPVSPVVKTTLVRTIKNVKLRRGRPSIAAPVVHVILAHIDVVVAKFEIGDSIDGNAYWYGDVQGNYLWAGATDRPDPRVIAG